MLVFNKYKKADPIELFSAKIIKSFNKKQKPLISLNEAFALYRINEYYLDKDDESPEYVYEDDTYKDVSLISVHEITNVEPLPEWTVAKVGIHMLTGEFYRVDARPKSYGFYMGGEETYQRLSLEEFHKYTKRTDITEENALNFVPKIEEPKAKEIKEKKIENKDINISISSKYDVAYLYISIKRRFATDTLRLIKYKNGYRVLSNYYSPDFPNNYTSRHLSSRDVDYVLSVFPNDKPVNGSGEEYGSANISLYGGEIIMAYCILCDGYYFNLGDNKCVLDVFDRLEEVTNTKIK